MLRRTPRIIAIVTACLGLALVLAVPDAAPVLPAFLLLAVLGVGYFPGEEALERLRCREAQPRQARPTSQLRPATPMRVSRSGILLAFALAMRPPPAAFAVPTQ